MADETLTTKLQKIASGQKYNRLLALEFVSRDSRSVSQWRFRCDCGTEVTVVTNHVRSGNTKSCGCLKSYTASKIGKANKTHGRARTSIYVAWKNMWRRCNDEDSDKYKYYGGRGIVVCDRWKKFENFLDDMGEHPGKAYSIDRIDNDGIYSPENCRWATKKQQEANKRPRSLAC